MNKYLLTLTKAEEALDRALEILTSAVISRDMITCNINSSFAWSQTSVTIAISLVALGNNFIGSAQCLTTAFAGPVILSTPRLYLILLASLSSVDVGDGDSGAGIDGRDSEGIEEAEI